MSGRVLKKINQADFETISSWMVRQEDLVNICGGAFSFPLRQDEFERYFVLGSAGDKDRLCFKWVDERLSKTLGMISYTRVDWANDYGHIGMVAVDPESRGNGMGSSMMKAALGVGFEDLGFNRIDLVVVENNVRAYKFYVDRIGFRSEGLARDIVKVEDGYVSCFVLSMLRDDWLRMNNGLQTLNGYCWRN